jgi:hypothetical protein
MGQGMRNDTLVQAQEERRKTEENLSRMTAASLPQRGVAARTRFTEASPKSNSVKIRLQYLTERSLLKQ